MMRSEGFDKLLDGAILDDARKSPQDGGMPNERNISLLVVALDQRNEDVMSSPTTAGRSVIM